VVQLAGASSISLVNELLLAPSDYHNWSPDERHKWRQDNMKPPTLTNWASWSVMQAGGGAETNKANGGAPDVDSSGLRYWGTQGGKKGKP
jgi:hypothetical protein